MIEPSAAMSKAQFFRFAVVELSLMAMLYEPGASLGKLNDGAATVDALADPLSTTFTGAVADEKLFTEPLTSVHVKVQVLLAEVELATKVHTG